MKLFDGDLLRGRVALITGGSGETGGGIARAFAAAGADLALTFHANEAGARKTAAGVADSFGTRAEVFFHDLYDRAANRALPGEVAKKLGRLDFLVNCAGGPGIRDLRTAADEVWDRALAGNLTGPFLLAREAGLIMEKTGGGCVVNIAATSAMKFSHGPYGIAKAAEVTMTRFLAHALAPKVRVLCIIPGLLEIEEVNAEARKKRAAASPLGRNVAPDDIGAMCVAVCSPVFGAVSGESIIMDGGFWLKHP